MQAREFPSSEALRASWFAIVGAPRCGTTSIARYLASHPDICFSVPKEPHFFSRQDLRRQSPSDVGQLVERDYVERFFPTQSGGAVLAEGSVSYLYAPERMLPILRIWPEARFIIAIRSPLEMLPSLHRRNLYNGDETVRDFRRAWSLVEERRSGRSIPRSCLDRRLLDYKEIGRLGRHVRRFSDLLGRHRCFISVFDDLVAAPAEQHLRMLEFLGLPSAELPDFPIHRAGSQIRFGWLQRLLKRPPAVVRNLLASDAYLARSSLAGSPNDRPGTIGRRTKSIRKRLLRWNRAAPAPIELDDELRAEMREWFRDDILDLSAFVGRDLRHWLDPARPA